MVNSYRDLIVWQKSMEFVELIYKQISSFPKNEDHCLSAQIRRSAVSIPSNIAEGYGRNTRADYRRFLSIARGSLYEVQTQLEIACRLNYLYDEDNKLKRLSIEIEKMLNSLFNKLK